MSSPGLLMLLLSLPAVPPTSRLVIEAQTERIVLGRDGTLDLRLVVEGETALAAGALPRLRANLGTVSSIQTDGPGAFRAQLALPAGAPGVLVIAAALAVPGGTLYGAARLQLAALAEIEIETSRNAVVIVDCGGREYGPLYTDDRGHARLDIEVDAPSVRYRYRVTGSSGRIVHREEEAIVGEQGAPKLVIAPLPDGVRPPAAIAIAAAHADREAQITCAVDGRELERRAAGGELALFTAEVAAGVSRIAVDCHDAAGQTARAEVPVGPNRPALLRARTPERYIAGDEPPLLRIEVLDASGLPVPLLGSVRVGIEAVGGDWTASADLLPGDSLEVALPIPASFRGATHARLTVTTYEPELVAEAFLALEPGAPATLRLSGVDERVTADGSDSISVGVDIRDAHENPAASPVLADTELGTIESGPALRYVAPLLDRDGRDVLQVRAGQASARAEIDLVAPTSMTVGVAAGLLRVADASLFGTALEAEGRRGRLGVLLNASFGAGPSTKRLDDGTEIQESWRTGMATAGLCYAARAHRRIVLRGAATLGGVLMRNDFRVMRDGAVLRPSQRETTLAPAAGLSGALLADLGAWWPELHAQIVYAPPLRDLDGTFAIFLGLGLNRRWSW